MARLGKYELLERIGMGGMAEIWRARTIGPEGFEKTVALKRILPHLIDNRQFIEMFIHEAKLVASLTHPNIVQVFDFEISDEGEHFITMEYVAGPNLAHVVTRLHEEQLPLPYEVSIYIISEASKGLGFAHEFKDRSGELSPIIHRDISPHNLLVSRQGAVKVADYGIAKVQSAIGNTQAGVLKGKIAYMSPEYVRQEGIDHRSDLFSLGIVLFRLVTGGKLFAGDNTAQILTKIAEYEGPTEADVKNLPPGLQNVLRVALQLDPQDRYQTALDFEAALSSIIDVKGLFTARKNLAELIETLYGDQFKPNDRGFEPTDTESDMPSLVPRETSRPSSLSRGSSSRGSRSGGSSGGEFRRQADEPAPIPRDPTAVTSAHGPVENTDNSAGPEDATLAMPNPLLNEDGSEAPDSLVPEVSQPSLVQRPPTNGPAPIPQDSTVASGSMPGEDSGTVPQASTLAKGSVPDEDPGSVPQNPTLASSSVPTGAPSEDGTKILERDGPPSISRPNLSAPQPSSAPRRSSSAPRPADPLTPMPSMPAPQRAPAAAVVHPHPMPTRDPMSQTVPHDPDRTNPLLPQQKKSDNTTLWLLAVLPLLVGLFILLLAIYLMGR